jgi:mannose-6-phosphate isomerase-like protein (cupin superfamily)
MIRTDSPESNPPERKADDRLTFDLFGTLVTLQVRSEETDGAYAILEMAVPPGGGPFRMHAHAASETFQVLEGGLEFRTLRDDQPVIIHAEASDIVHIPPHMPHVFRNISGRPASCQIVIAPGSMEGYFLEFGTPVSGDAPTGPPKEPPTTQQFIEIGRKYGVKTIES